MKREVVITGVGVVSPIGIGRDAFWSALDEGRSGIRVVPELAATDIPFRLAGQFTDFDPKQYVQPRKTIKVMCREIQASYAAAIMAMQDAALTKEQLNPQRLGVVLGSGLSEALDALEHPQALEYAEVAHMPRTGTAGHPGSLLRGDCGDVSVLALCGRIHVYEGRPLHEVCFGVRLLSLLGVHTLLVTSQWMVSLLERL